jgi:hypothetical protein
MEQKLVKRSDNDIVADACNASYPFLNILSPSGPFWVVKKSKLMRIEILETLE